MPVWAVRSGRPESPGSDVTEPSHNGVGDAQHPRRWDVTFGALLPWHLSCTTSPLGPPHVGTSDLFLLSSSPGDVG